ncbi:MAG: hypothetical protein MJK04_29605 [Psychrosphaera sp.]|nr:hypothetical protein [Psychrosphaera sp.]
MKNTSYPRVSTPVKKATLNHQYALKQMIFGAITHTVSTHTRPVQASNSIEFKGKRLKCENL